MATFHIHEDQEKENRISAPTLPKIKQGLVNNKEKRQTFAVLNKVGINDGKLAKRDCDFKQQTKNIIANEFTKNHAVKLKAENQQSTISQIVNVGAAALNTAKDKSNNFSVYEDCKENIKKRQNDKDITDNLQSNISLSAIRHPLQEIKRDELLETPMSVSEVLSPMSIDKSVIDDKLNSPAQPKNDRERFFDIEEYQMDILEYLREAETRNRPKFGYMRKQPDINHSMRTILVDWLVEVSEEYRLQSETLCLAVSYIDRFLSYMSVVRAKLQLVGTAAMFIASKYEEIYPPDVAEFVYITDDTYAKRQVLRMEQLILKVLSFDLTVPTTYVFMNSYAIMNNIPDKIKFLAMYLCELSLLEADPYLMYLPSQIAAAALALARFITGYPIWSKELEKKIGYNVEKLEEIVLHLSRSHEASVTSQQQAVQEKYKNNKYLQVSLISPCKLDEEDFIKAIETMDEYEKRLVTTQENNENVRKMISSLIFV